MKQQIAHREDSPAISRSLTEEIQEVPDGDLRYLYTTLRVCSCSLRDEKGEMVSSGVAPDKRATVN